jgi:hypothetical protein
MLPKSLPEINIDEVPLDHRIMKILREETIEN